MNRRFLTAAIGLALCALAMPASARPYADDDDGDRYARRRHYERYERSYDRDDEEDGGYQRRRRHSRRAVRQRTHAQGARKAPSPGGRKASAAQTTRISATAGRRQAFAPVASVASIWASREA